MPTNGSCGICGDPMTDQEHKAYGCELCPAWVHAKWVFPNVSDAKLKILFEFNAGFDVKCRDCKVKKLNWQIGLQKIIKQQASFIEDRFQLPLGFNVANNSVQSELKAIIVEVLTGSNSFIGEIGQKLEKVSEIVQELSDQKEKKIKRKNNLILFKLPESTELDPDEQIKADCRTVKDISQEKLTLVPGDIKNIVRLSQKEKGKVRPLLIKFKNEHKKDVQNSARGLRLIRDSTTYLIYASVDRTP